MEPSPKVIIISGSGQGIGLCLAEHFILQGARVILAETSQTAGRAAEQKFNVTHPGQALFIQTDMGREDSVRAMVHATLQHYGQIDNFVHNAATACNQPVTELSWEDWRRVIDTNLSGAFLGAKHCVPSLRRQRGAIVLIASTRALMSESNTEAYSASKAGLAGLTHALAVSLGPAVRVNCISPGWIDTRDYLPAPEIYPYTISDADHAQHPCGRVGKPQDIAEMALYLCSDRAGFITGQNFVIDGGMTRKMIYI